MSSGSAGKDVQRKLKLRDVLYVPDLTTSLISCSQLCRAGYDIKFKEKRGRVMGKDYIGFECRVDDGVYVIDYTRSSDPLGNPYTTRASTLSLWHDRLGHAHLESIRELERVVLLCFAGAQLNTNPPPQVA